MLLYWVGIGHSSLIRGLESELMFGRGPSAGQVKERGIQMPTKDTTSDSKKEDPVSGTKEVTKGKREYLIGPRRSRRSRVAGVQPMGALQLQSAISSMQGMGLEVVEVIRPRRALATLAASGVATETYVVRM